MKKDPEGEGKKIKRAEEKKNEYFVEEVEKILAEAGAPVRWFVLDAESMVDVDTTGSGALRQAINGGERVGRHGGPHPLHHISVFVVVRRFDQDELETRAVRPC